jgi:hypothetical protein
MTRPATLGVARPSTTCSSSATGSTRTERLSGEGLGVASPSSAVEHTADYVETLIPALTAALA